MDYLNYFLDKDIAHVMSTDNMITLEGYADSVNGASILRFDIEKNHEQVQELLAEKPAETENNSEQAAPKSGEQIKTDGQKDTAGQDQAEEKQ